MRTPVTKSIMVKGDIEAGLADPIFEQLFGDSERVADDSLRKFKQSAEEAN